MGQGEGGGGNEIKTTLLSPKCGQTTKKKNSNQNNKASHKNWNNGFEEGF